MLFVMSPHENAMRTITALAIGWLLATNVYGQDDAAKERQRLQGTWVFVAVEVEGKTLDFFQDAKAAVTGDKVTITFAKGGKLVRTFKVFTDTNPKCVDFLPDGGKERPVTFADKGKSGHIYYVVERAK
jgi:uncharacterized protein (TIGR03067 family)